MDGLVLFLAVGAAVRIVAPLLADKQTDPSVVCVDEAGRFAVAVCGGHAGGGNDLARSVAEYLGAEAVITTATDSVGMTGLDQLPGFHAEGDVAAVTAALLDGRRITLVNPRGWPLPLTVTSHSPDATGSPEAPDTTDGTDGPDRPYAADRPGTADRPGGRLSLLVTDECVPSADGVVVLHPPSLVAGIGTSTAATADEVADLLATVLADSGLARESVSEIATIDRRVSHPALLSLGIGLRAFPSDALARADVPTPSETVLAAVGTPSVCEAAALLAAGLDGELVVAKRSGPTASVAIARRRAPRGHLAVVGLGPGGADHRTPATERAVRRADIVIGYRGYLDQCADLLGPAQQAIASPIGDEVVRAKRALAEAAAGRRVALVSSGDAGIYGMASIVLELADESVDVEVVPGMTAATAVAAVLGAPLGHDHAAISLSDLLTSWDVIERRLRAAAAADLVVSLYNPRSGARGWQLEAARDIFLTHRPPATPVGIVTDAGRPGQRTTITTLSQLDPTTVGMTTCVIVGASATRVIAGRMVTPRGYQ